MIFHSDNTHYVNVFFFNGSQVVKQQIEQYKEKEATQMYQRVINKYKDTKERVLVCLRDKDDQLVKSQLINYPAS